jgi:beta-lactamase class D
MLVEKTSSYYLWAKSGWATKVKPQVGWYVGYVETPTDVWLFALNIETRNDKELPLRMKLSREALKAKGIIK